MTISVEDPISAQLIREGLRALVDHPDEIIFRGFRSEDVINAAGASQATFYRRFATKRAFLHAVLDTMHAHDDCSVESVRATVAGQIATNANVGRSVVRALAEHYFDALTDRTTLSKNLMSHLLAISDARTARAVQAHFRRRDELAIASVDVAFERTGASLRTPFTTKSLGVALTALVDGFRLRINSDPAAVTSNLAADTIVALLNGAIAMPDRHEHIDDVLTTHYPAVPSAELPRDLRAAILGAAREEFDARGYFGASMEAVGARAGVPIGTVRTLFPNKPHLIIGALRRHVAELTEAVADDTKLTLDETTVISNHLLRLAQLTARETAFMDALLVALAHDTRGEPDGLLSLREQVDLPAIIAPVIAEAQRKGTLAKLAAPDELAATITNILLHRCFTRRADSPEENTAFIVELLLHGLARSAPTAR
ncbi:TetR/AcrR family transcriptional regulator [Nocardia caishijiensis]|uniref:TetR family transcriptional regulator n=1 Tax=Nocardia caishijiensis TaxID=184756 RepID=A0ABQ6YIB5_9NOCA|nr:TetR/AcrR family transcriptional regulator [Nocardia caishijiensis]KAF0845276.1 TetR family transcriptional regulator [Nocardia caishijiensis]